VNRLGDKTVGEEAVQQAAVSQAQEEACLATCQAVFAGQGGLNPGLEKTRVFYIKNQPSGFFFFFGFLGFFIYLPRRESLWGFSVSRILLGASRL
jgi:hypothetical protein